MPAVPIEQLADYVVKETVRQIRNGEIRLKGLGINCEPELKIDFNVTVIVPGGLNAITRTTGQTQKSTQKAGSRVTKQDSSGTSKATDSSSGTEDGTQTYGRNNVTDLTYEELA